MKLLSAPSALALLAQLASARYIMYADKWHTEDLGNSIGNAGIDHAIMAFVPSSDFLTEEGGGFELFEPVSTFRQRFYPGVKVMVAIGGWNDDNFTRTMTDAESRTRFANNAKKMIDLYDLDGIDIDYEYPGGNGADYKTVSNAEKEWEIQAFPELLKATRAAIGPDKILSIAVPGLERDMLAYTKDTMPRIIPYVDWFGIMAYDLMNRRDSYTKHHTDVVSAKKAVQRYLALGLPPSKATLGFAFYAKYFTVDPTSDCANHPLGKQCRVVSLENGNGSDDFLSGSLTFEPESYPDRIPHTFPVSVDGICGAKRGTRCPDGLCCSIDNWCGRTEEHCGLPCMPDYGKCDGMTSIASWQLAMGSARIDEVAGGNYFYDDIAGIFWTWEEPVHIARKFTEIVGDLGIENVMAWSLAEDAYNWDHLEAVQSGVKKHCLCELPGFNADTCPAASTETSNEPSTETSNESSYGTSTMLSTETSNETSTMPSTSTSTKHSTKSSTKTKKTKTSTKTSKKSTKTSKQTETGYGTS